MVVGQNDSDDFTLLLPLDFKFVNNAKKKNTGNAIILNWTFQVLQNKCYFTYDISVS